MKVRGIVGVTLDIRVCTIGNNTSKSEKLWTTSILVKLA
jgi:hypothetical protein